MQCRPVFSFQQSRLTSIEPIRRGPNASHTRCLRAWKWHLRGEFLLFFASLPSWYCPEVRTRVETQQHCALNPPAGIVQVLFA